MPDIKVIRQEAQSETGVTGTQYGDAVPLDGAQTLMAQCDVSEVTGVASAAIAFQVSADPTNVTPSKWNDYIDSQNVTVNGVLVFEKVSPGGNWIRAKYTAPTGSFDVATQIVVKGAV